MTRPLLLALFPVILACGGLFGGEDSLADLGACEGYLACVSEVEPSTYAALAASYGPDGTCWSADATAEGCREACENALEDLAEAFIDEDECEPIDGWPDPGGCPFESGRWFGEWEDQGGECILAEMEVDAELACLVESEGWFLIEMHAPLNRNFECTSDGYDFDCVVPEADSTLSGTFERNGEVFEGTATHDFEGCGEVRFGGRLEAP